MLKVHWLDYPISIMISSEFLSKLLSDVVDFGKIILTNLQKYCLFDFLNTREWRVTKNMLNPEKNDNFDFEKATESPDQDNLIEQSKKNKNYSLFSSLDQSAQQICVRLNNCPFVWALLTLSIVELLTGFFADYQAVDIASRWIAQLEYKENIILEPVLSTFNPIKKKTSDNSTKNVLELKQKVDNLENKINLSNSNLNTLDTYLNELSARPNKAEKLILEQQLKTISNRASTHLQLAVDYNKWLFIILSLSAISSGLAGICLFYLSKEGWEKAEKYIVHLFVLSSGLAIFCGSLPLIFQIQKSAEDNTKLYLGYINLKNQILTDLTLQTNISKSSTSKSSINSLTSLQNTIQQTNLKLVELNALTVGFNPNSVLMPNGYSQKEQK